VSIFGPGRGEAIAVHMGAGDWITVDSCVDQTTGKHPLLQYFSATNVEVKTQVRLVVGTHAHDDHLAGISRVFDEAQDAQFVSSAALTSEEFYNQMEADEDIEGQLGISVRSEYRAVYDEVQRRKKLPDGRYPMLKATQERVLWSRPQSPRAPSARVLALSPSDRAIERAQRNLAEGSAKASQRRRLSATDPNEIAVALWIEVGSVAALLGADLLVGPDNCGWKAVLSWHRPTDKASLFKIPHHGSPNADLPAVWSQLLTDDVVSLVAPFRLGVTPRPSPEDAARIVSLSSSAYATAKSRVPTPPKAVKRIRAALSNVAVNVRDPYGQTGHARARRKLDSDDWTVELFEPAHKLP
jgi:beta-lactamase superfamily II metal-dependent hydrolase